MRHDLTLITKVAYPFAQQVEIALNFKSLSYDRRLVDLSNKPDWFMRASPLGKVPGLTHIGSTFFESLAILEYLEEEFPEGALMPATAADRARMRLWPQGEVPVRTCN